MSYKLKIGIIGGTGLDQDHSILKDITRVRVPITPYGDPSDLEVICGKISGIEVFIMGRHGRNHQFNPTDVNYRANLWTFKNYFGCTHVLATNAVGSLKESIVPGDLGVIDQYIDRTSIRTGRSFYKVSHIPQAEPYDRDIQEIFLKSCQSNGYKCHPKLTAVCIEGPRFSTLAESLLYRSWNCDIIGMTMVPEAQLAAEIGLIYGSLALITDYDCWHQTNDSVSVDLVANSMKELSQKAIKVLGSTIKFIAEKDWSNIIEKKQKMAQNAIMTE